MMKKVVLGVALSVSASAIYLAHYGWAKQSLLSDLSEAFQGPELETKRKGYTSALNDQDIQKMFVEKISSGDVLRCIAGSNVTQNCTPAERTWRTGRFLLAVNGFANAMEKLGYGESAAAIQDQVLHDVARFGVDDAFLLPLAGIWKASTAPRFSLESSKDEEVHELIAYSVEMLFPGTIVGSALTGQQNTQNCATPTFADFEASFSAGALAPSFDFGMLTSWTPVGLRHSKIPVEPVIYFNAKETKFWTTLDDPSSNLLQQEFSTRVGAPRVAILFGEDVGRDVVTDASMSFASMFSNHLNAHVIQITPAFVDYEAHTFDNFEFLDPLSRISRSAFYIPEVDERNASQGGSCIISCLTGPWATAVRKTAAGRFVRKTGKAYEAAVQSAVRGKDPGQDPKTWARVTEAMTSYYDVPFNKEVARVCPALCNARAAERDAQRAHEDQQAKATEARQDVVNAKAYAQKLREDAQDLEDLEPTLRERYDNTSENLRGIDHDPDASEEMRARAHQEDAKAEEAIRKNEKAQKEMPRKIKEADDRTNQAEDAAGDQERRLNETRKKRDAERKRRKKIEDDMDVDVAAAELTRSLTCDQPGFIVPRLKKCEFIAGRWQLVDDEDKINEIILIRTCGLIKPAPGYTCVVQNGVPKLVQIFPLNSIGTPTSATSRYCASVRLQGGAMCVVTDDGPKIVGPFRLNEERPEQRRTRSFVPCEARLGVRVEDCQRGPGGLVMWDRSEELQDFFGSIRKTKKVCTRADNAPTNRCYFPWEPRANVMKFGEEICWFE